MIHEIFSEDSFRAVVRVQSNGTAFPMTGATVTASASDSATTVAGTVDMSQAGAAEIGVSFAAGALTVGDWEIQVRATLAGQTQTVARTFVRVLPAI